MSSTDSCLQYRQLFRAQSAVYCNSARTNTWRTHCTLFSAITHTSNAGCVIKQATVTWCFVKNSFLMSYTKLRIGVEFPKSCVKSVSIQTQQSPQPLARLPIPLTCVKCLRSTMPYVSVRKFRKNFRITSTHISTLPMDLRMSKFSFRPKDPLHS